MVPRPVSLRVFLVATEQGYRVMPGGLTRVSPEAGGRFISMQRGGTSKDTWIISETPVEEFTLLHGAHQNVELRRTGNNLPSRLADNFFWLGRYSERADATARLLRSALQRFNPERGGGAQALVGAAVGNAGDSGPVARHLRPAAGVAPERRGVRGGVAGGDF